MTDPFLKILQARPVNFSEFHALACKHMPDVTRYPEQYGQCYNLMKLTWNAAIISALGVIDEKL